MEVAGVTTTVVVREAGTHEAARRTKRKAGRKNQKV